MPAYDADGNRVWQTVGGVETHYIWDWVESGANYYYFGGRKVAMRTGTITYLCGDHLTSTVETNDSGANLSQLYYPYGAERRSGSLPTPYRYTGQRWESAIGLYFYNARWYDPALGRFIQPDSIVPEPGNPQALNRYTYAGNNPIRYNDPTGHAREIGGGPKRWVPPQVVAQPAPAPLTVSVTPEPPKATSTWAGDREFFGSLYVSQGENPNTGRPSNDCGPANVAMAVNYAGGKGLLEDAIRAMGPRDRLSAFWGDAGGATFPWGVSSAFNRISKAQGLGWTAQGHALGRLGGKARLLGHLEKGPVTVVLAYKFTSAHYVTVVGADSHDVYFLDPDPPLANVALKGRVQSQSWATFLHDWLSWVVWNWPGGYMITYAPPYAGPVPIPPPTPSEIP